MTAEPAVSELVERAKSGSREAFGRLAERYGDLVYGLSLRIARDTDMAEDLSQETFVKAFSKLHTLRKPESFVSWLCSIARRTALDHVRKGKRELTGLDRTLEIETATEDDPPAHLTGSKIIENALMKLGERDRELLTLAYYEELSLAEVGKILDIPEGNVRVYLYRARQRLRKKLKGFEDDLLQQIG
ncbi:sigma-70 family RNA polymerase sigma factor [Candidatus Fermentibacteria bacterium]|nr:sigma-70 family RNA polymerase sigma factor [Candidatus Fermentibacteria bacterium]